MRVNILIFTGLCTTVLAQDQGIRDSHSDDVVEVASLRPSTSNSATSMRGGPGTSDPTQLRWTNVSLTILLEQAYKLKDYQIKGPKWLESEYFDLLAKLPEGTTLDQLRIMLQNLLLDRFHMKVHRTQTEGIGYDLVVGKRVTLLTSSELNVTSDSVPGQRSGPAKLDKDGFPQPTPGVPTLLGKITPGHFREVGRMQSISQIAAFLSGRLEDSPIIDKTGLSGVYDFRLDFAPSEGIANMLKNLAVAPDSPSAPDLLTAVEEQLGLRLVPVKVAVDLLVVDEALQRPTDN